MFPVRGREIRIEKFFSFVRDKPLPLSGKFDLEWVCRSGLFSLAAYQERESVNLSQPACPEQKTYPRNRIDLKEIN